MPAPRTERALRVGEPAPDFSLDSTAGERFTLSSLRDAKHALLAFFPLAFTSTCAEEMCDFGAGFDQFLGRGVEVLPISVDSIPTLREWKRSLGLELELLSDFKRDVSRMYGVLHPEKFHAMRSYFLVHRDGTLRWSHIEEHGGFRRTNDELFDAIARVTEAG